MTKTKNRARVDMLSGSPLKSIIAFGLPIFFGSVFQQLYSMVDSIVVGNYVGADALAAVGSSSTVSNCLIMAASGLTMGASVVVAQLFGAGQRERIKSAISTTLIFMVALSVVLTVLGVSLASNIVGWVKVPANILEDSATYIRVYLSGFIFLMMYNFFAAILRALGDSRTPLVYLIISSLLNIVGDLIFVLVFHLGVAGVAWATVISQAVSVVLCAVHVFRKVEYFKFKKGEFIFSRLLFRDILRLGIPSAIQGSVTSLGFVIVQGLVNSFGSINIAAYTAASKMEGLAHLPVESFAMALSVYVGQNMGAGDIRRTKKGLWNVVVFSCVICAATAALIYAVGPWLISLFVDNSETEVISRGARFMRAFAPFIVLHSMMNCFNAVLRGSGDSMFAMCTMLGDLGFRVVMAFALCYLFKLDFIGCAYAIPCGWALATIISSLRYRTGKWQTKTVKSAREAIDS